MSWNKLEFLGIPRTLGIQFARAKVKCHNFYHLGQKVLRILHLLTNRTPTLQICYHYGPSTRPTLVKVV